jgi:hypothetical protein
VQELPRPAWYRQVWMLNLAIAVVVVAALVAATVVVGSRRDQRANRPMVTGAPATTAAAQGGASEPPPTATTTTSSLPRTTSSAKLGVLWERSGSEGYYGAPFEVPNGWHLVWSFDCRSFKKYGGGNFKISGEGELDGVSVQRFAVRGSGSETVAGGGRGRLVIETVCDRWTVKAVAP